MPILAAIVFSIFVFVLPLLMLLTFVPGALSADEAWLLRACFPFLSPPSAVLWFIVLHRLFTYRRSRYLHQFLVFLATPTLMFLLIKLGVYRIG